ncbi:hypothetical protein [Candidatus Bathycorpusculum sp.]|uniref:hypothetical protein n=1 Tax=Candidatus Bathycorpusculum sp. TaxID=2994959 RepID=UPI002818FFDF|nr:hypothetical protein [Candidatus Termitimicrobium sp.]
MCKRTVGFSVDSFLWQSVNYQSPKQLLHRLNPLTNFQISSSPGATAAIPTSLCAQFANIYFTIVFGAMNDEDFGIAANFDECLF